MGLECTISVIVPNLKAILYHMLQVLDIDPHSLVGYIRRVHDALNTDEEKSCAGWTSRRN